MARRNIVSLYHEAGGTAPPWVTLPYWVLWLLVRLSVALAVLAHGLFGGLQILSPKTGLHEAALAAGSPATMASSRAGPLLGYEALLLGRRHLVMREAAARHCTAWVAAGGAADPRAAAAGAGAPPPPITPLLQVVLQQS